MKDEIHEQLSALCDGELADDSARFLLKRLNNDSDLQGVWARYHLIRDCLQKQTTHAGSDFCARVAQALDDEGARDALPAARVTRVPSRLWMGGAIAASVAVIAFLGLRGFSGTESAATLAVVPAASLDHVAPLSTSDLSPQWPLVEVSGRQTIVSGTALAQEEVDALFLLHAEAAGGAGVSDLIPVVQSLEPAQADRP
jgi:sigma-E factor negative regulatory protein RseA